MEDRGRRTCCRHFQGLNIHQLSSLGPQANGRSQTSDGPSFRLRLPSLNGTEHFLQLSSPSQLEVETLKMLSTFGEAVHQGDRFPTSLVVRNHLRTRLEAYDQLMQRLELDNPRAVRANEVASYSWLITIQTSKQSARSVTASSSVTRDREIAKTD